MNILFMFPGQGSQCSGMGYELYNNFDVAKRTMEEAEDILKINLCELCFNKELSKQLNQTSNAQFAIFAVGVAAYRVLHQETEIVPEYGMGHSLGELTALACANAVGYHDMLSILKERSQIIQSHISNNTGTMMWVVNLNHTEVEELCREQQEKGFGVHVSGFNSPQQVAISGETNVIMKTARKLERMGAIVYPLHMEGPFHSIYMQEAADEFMSYLDNYTFNPFNFKVLSIMTALPYNGPEDIKQLLSRCIASPIQWMGCIQYALNQEIDAAVEIGAKNILSFLLKNNTDKIKAYNFQAPADLQKIKEIIP